MAVTKIWTVTSNISDVQSYIANPEKTSITYEEYELMHTPDIVNDGSEEISLVRGINCSPKHAVEQFNMVKEQYDKASNSIQAYHGCISFGKEEVTPKETVDIARDFVESVWGDNYQVLLAAHLNTQHLHCHFLINSVSFVDGHMLHAEKAWFIFRQTADMICEKYGKNIIDEPNRSHNKGPTDRESAAKTCMDRALASSKSFAEFLSNIQCEPCTVNFSMHNKKWTILPEGWTVPVTTNKLGAEYSKESILERFPDADKEIERFTVPEVLERVDLTGYQAMVADRIMTTIKDNMVVNEREPSRTYLPHKMKKEVMSMSSGLEAMAANNITSKPLFDRFLMMLSQRLIDLNKKKTKYLSEHLDIKDIGKEIIELSETKECLEQIRKSFDIKNVDGDQIRIENEKSDIDKEGGRFI